MTCMIRCKTVGGVLPKLEGWRGWALGGVEISLFRHLAAEPAPFAMADTLKVARKSHRTFRSTAVQ